MEIIRLHCSQCNEIFLLDDFYEIVCDEDGFLFLCSKECKDKYWDELGTLEIQS